METRKELCLRLDNFDASIRQFWKESQSQKELCDVTLACEDKLIEAHRFILFCGSPILRNILMQNPNKHPVIYLRGVKFGELCNILEFMYQGEVSIPEDQLNTFLAVAEDLKIKGLTEETKTAVNDETESPNDIEDLSQDDSTPENQDKDGYENNGNHRISSTYPCDQCTYEAKSKGNLKKHKQSIHEKIKYPCPHPWGCDYESTQSSHLNRHIRNFDHGRAISYDKRGVKTIP